MEEAKSQDQTGLTKPTQRVDATFVAKLNLADYQNSVPVLRELSIVNEADEPVAELALRVESVPPFIKPKTWRIDSVEAASRYHLAGLDLPLDGALLTRLTEAEMATVQFVLTRDAETPEELARRECTVELLPRNHWGGLSQLPDLIAAFVQPNEPAVDRLLKLAAEILRRNGKSANLDGYVDGPKRAWELASGIWSAVAAMELNYALPPASFEHAGQKVRSPAQIADSGLATCLDLALLFCSALEQAGLNPLLVFTRGHAVAGLWLKPEEFSTTVVDDITALRKRVKLQELVLFETTMVTQRPAPAFSFAIRQAEHQISQEQEESFELAVDIRRARLQRIKPLASVEVSPALPSDETALAVEPPIENAPDLPEDGFGAEPDAATLNPKDRLARWQRKLLDLSLRNNLLNFRAGKKALKLEVPDPGAVEDLLAEGEALKLLPRPDLMDGADPRDREIYVSREHEDLRRSHALEALARRQVFVGFPKDEMETRLVELYRAARNTLQEGGANTLFLALGFLSWTRDDKLGPRYRAPLILVPVSLSRKNVRSGFALTLHEDEPRVNPTLIEMLRQDFKLNLGVADGELPRDDSGLDVAAIWKSVSLAIKDIKGWDVTDDVVLAMFSFAKYLMWKDLAEWTDQLRENAVVRHLIDTPTEHYPSGVAFPVPNRLDHEFGPQQTFCPLPTDSSQLSAVMAAAKGKDFVLIGPPGTGKSQTIANLIAQCLAEGKRVLFVSEKIAALDVVYRRLREVGLGEFCLELHSSKARKLDVLAQLRQAWEARGDVDSEAWRAEAVRLKRLRDELNAYVERLHLRHPNGMSIHQAIGCVAEGKDIPILRFSWSAANAHDLSTLDGMRQTVDRLEVNARQIGIGSGAGAGALLTNPLAAIAQADWSPSWQQRLIEAGQDLFGAARAVEQVHGRFAKATGIPCLSVVREARAAFAVLARSLPQAAGCDWRFVLRTDAPAIAARLGAGTALLARHRALTAALSSPWPAAVTSACRRGLELLHLRWQTLAQLAQPWPADVFEDLGKGIGLLDEIAQMTAQFSVQYGNEVEQLDVTGLNRQWARAEKSIWPLSWFRKRKIRKQLDATVMSEGEPDFAKDVRLLATIRVLKSEVSAREMPPEVGGVWFGLKTRREVARCALTFQQALNAARHEQPWNDAGFEPIAEGRCGLRLAEELTRMRILKALDTDLKDLDHLGAATEEIWAGIDTRTERLEAALWFMNALDKVRASRALAGDHEMVACGGCGSAFAEDFQRLQQRSDIERQLRGYDDLREITAGLWDGLNTRHDEVDRALEFHTAIATAIPRLAATSEQIGAVKAPLERLLGEDNMLLDPAGAIAAAGKEYLQALGSLQPAIDLLATAGSFSGESSAEFGDLPLPDLVERSSGIVHSASRLHAWCAWRQARDQAVNVGLASLVTGIESGGVAPGTVRRAFETN